MGEFHVRLADGDKTLAEWKLKNLLAYEGMDRFLHRLFPTHMGAMTLRLGVSGPDKFDWDERPNPPWPVEGPSYDRQLTFWDCTDGDANEGGCYTEEMRDSFGYSRHVPNVTIEPEGRGITFFTDEAAFPNTHSWSPQDGGDWDLSWTEDIEQPPPEWTPKKTYEPVVGYPWQTPRKKATTEDDGESSPTYNYSYMHQWQADGSLDWLYDFRKMGGFPITTVWLADIDNEELLAAAYFRGPVLLRPGLTLYVSYKARLYSEQATMAFHDRLLRVSVGGETFNYSTLYCRPVKDSMPTMSPTTTYADLEPYFDVDFDAIELADWLSMPYTAESAGGEEEEPYLVCGGDSALPIEWANTYGVAKGPFAGIAVWGVHTEDSIETEELCWFIPFAQSESVPDGDSLIVPEGIRLYVDSE